MVYGCDDISKLLEMEDEIEQVSKQAGDVAGYYHVDEEIHVSADRVPYGATSRKPTIEDLVEEYTAKLDYLLAIRTLVKKNIPLDFYA